MTTTNINTGVNSLSAAKATEIENGVMLYEFNSEAETEAAVIECIEKGVKFNTTGRRSLVIYQPAPAVADEYAVTYGGEAIATTTSEEEAHEIAKGEAEAERTIIKVIRKSDNTVIAVYDFTATPTTDTTNNVLATLKSELQEYHDNTSKGGENRRRNMALLAWDIRRIERKHAAILERYKIHRDATFMYMLLARMQMDCKAYIQPEFPQKHLWAGNVAEQITIMRALWHSVPEAPEWLTLEQIDEYAKQMNA